MSLTDLLAIRHAIECAPMLLFLYDSPIAMVN